MAKKKTEKQKFIDKINKRIKAQIKAGVSWDLIQSEIIDSISGVTATKKGISIKDEDFDEDLKKVIEQKITTKTQLMSKISKDDAYNIDKADPTEKDKIEAYNSRLFMNSVMDNQFKKYYDLIVNNSVENVLTSPELSHMKTDMGNFARALQRGNLDEARDIYDTWLDPLLKGKTLEEIEGEKDA